MDKAEVARHFAEAYATYDASAVVQRNIARKMVALLGACGFPEGGAVYEVGAGTGLLTGPLLKCFRPVRFVVNDLCREAAIPLLAISPSITFLPGDAERMSVPEGCEHVVSCSAVQWFADPGAFFRLMAEGLPSGGFLAFSTFGPENLREIRAVAGVGLDYTSTGTLRELLAAAGFEVRCVEEDIEPLVFCSVADLLRHIRETGTGGVSAEPWPLVRTLRFCKEYAAQFSVEGGVLLTYHNQYFVTVKR